MECGHIVDPEEGSPFSGLVSLVLGSCGGFAQLRCRILHINRKDQVVIWRDGGQVL